MNVNGKTIVAFLDRMQAKTERLLTWRKARKAKAAAAKATAKGEALDWVHSFAFAVVAVFLVSLYFFQLFVIPSESMMTTLNISNRIGVYKRAYGTELCSFGYKTDSRWANEGDVIVFYNPAYSSKGIVRENIENFLFLVTFSIYNPSKEGKLYVKRSVGTSGDRLFFENGDLFVQRFSSDVAEKESDRTRGFTRRLLDEEDERHSGNYGRMLSYSSSAYPKLMPAAYYDSEASIAGASKFDYFTMMQSKADTDARIMPYSANALCEKKRMSDGYYLKGGYVMPLGDNRDNSQDGRYFGPVRMNKVIGKGMFRFWPLSGIKRL